MLHNLYSVRIESVSVIMGVSTRSVKRWIALFEQTGNVVKDLPRARSARWPEQVYQHIQSFIQENPCFYVESRTCESIDTMRTTISIMSEKQNAKF